MSQARVACSIDDRATQALPLVGIRVVEMSHMVMGPACGLILAQLGADVIKVEPPGGDKTRQLDGMGAGFFPMFNRGKRSLVLDLTQEEGKAAMWRLLESADVFVENFRDETVSALGLDAKTLRRKYPRLVVCSNKGFLSGPYEQRPALDEVVQMMTGLAAMTGSPEQPMRTGCSVNDIMGGLFAAFGIVAALLRRQRGDAQGGELRVGLFENSLFLVAQHLVQFQVTGQPVPPMSKRIHAWPIYDTFETADGERLFVAVTTDGAWRAFCRGFALDDLLSDPHLQTTAHRIARRADIVPIVALRLVQKTRDQIEATLEPLGIPFARINMPSDLLEDPHVLKEGRLSRAKTADGVEFQAPSLPLELDGSALCRPANVPTVGADGASILEALGYDTVQIARLARRKVT